MKDDLKSRGVHFDAYSAKKMMGNGKKSQKLGFNTGLKEFCQTGDCSKWDTKGEYYTVTGPTGQNQLVMKIDVIAPEELSGTYNKAVFDVSTTKDGTGASTTEQLACTFAKYAKRGKCVSKLYNKSLVTMHQEQELTKVLSKETNLWKNLNSKVSGKRIRIRAKRDYKPSNGAQYRAGDEKPFYVNVAHEKNEVVGKTPLVNMYLFEGENAPVTVRMLRTRESYVDVPVTGSNAAGVIITILVLLLVAIAGGLYYWLKVRKQSMRDMISFLPEAASKCRGRRDTPHSVPRDASNGSNIVLVPSADAEVIPDDAMKVMDGQKIDVAPMPEGAEPGDQTFSVPYDDEKNVDATDLAVNIEALKGLQ